MTFCAKYKMSCGESRSSMDLLQLGSMESDLVPVSMEYDSGVKLTPFCLGGWMTMTSNVIAEVSDEMMLLQSAPQCAPGNISLTDLEQEGG